MQDDLEVFRPFNNIVKLKLDVLQSSALPQSGITEQAHTRIAEKLAAYGSVNGRFICDRGATGYFNFSCRQAKLDALKASLSDSENLPFKIEDYTVGQSCDKHELRPYRYVLCAAYRPSIHSTSRIIRYLDQFGANNGREIVNCPYDEDRRFVYFAYSDGRSLPKSARYCTYIEGSDVAQNYQILDKEPCNDVVLFPFIGHDVRKYNKHVDVFTRGVDPSRLRELLSDKYGDVSNVDKIRESEEGQYYNVSFKDKYSAYRILYQKTPYGRVIETVPGTSDHICISQSFVHKQVWKNHSLRLYHVPEIPDEDVQGYFDDFLNKIGCNPGIVAVARKKGVKSPFCELYFSNPWHTTHVYSRIIHKKSKAGSDHKLFCSIDKSGFYRDVKDVFE